MDDRTALLPEGLNRWFPIVVIVWLDKKNENTKKNERNKWVQRQCLLSTSTFYCQDNDSSCVFYILLPFGWYGSCAKISHTFSSFFSFSFTRSFFLLLLPQCSSSTLLFASRWCRECRWAWLASCIRMCVYPTVCSFSFSKTSVCHLGIHVRHTYAHITTKK